MSRRRDNIIAHKNARGACMKEVDRRLDRMIEISELLDVPLDHVVAHMGYCDDTTFLMLSGNPFSLPRYMKSSVTE